MQLNYKAVVNNYILITGYKLLFSLCLIVKYLVFLVFNVWLIVLWFRSTRVEKPWESESSARVTYPGIAEPSVRSPPRGDWTFSPTSHEHI